MRPTRSGTVGLLVLLAAGCDAPEQQASTEWSLGARTFEVGGIQAETDYTLTALGGATPLTNGQVLVADRQAPFLKVFASDGSFVRSMGSQGAGPGEYEFVLDLDWCAPGEITVHGMAGRVHRYSGTLEHLSTDLILLETLEGGTAYKQDCHPNGLRVVTGWGDISEQMQPGYYQAIAPVLLLRGQEVVHDFGMRLTSERVGSVRPDGSPAGSGPHPLGRATVVALGSDRVYVGAGDSYEIEAFDLTGSPLPPLQWDGPGLDYSDDIVQRFADQAAAEVDEEDRPRIRRRYLELPPLDQLPAYDDFVVSDVDELWVHHFTRPGDVGEVWTVFDPNGALAGRLALPRGSTLWGVWNDRVVYSVLDDFDVPVVRIDAIER